jgi:cyclopropane-fatty-acyl-phospholipid synthase
MTTLARRTLLSLLDSGLADCAVRFEDPDGSATVGRAAAHVAPLVVKVHRARFYDRVISTGNLGLGESFVDGDFTTDGPLEDLLCALLRNQIGTRFRAQPMLLLKAAAIRLRSVVAGKAGNVRRHYDVGTDLFEQFLDSTMTYSCGYARSPGDDLEALQQNKLARICDKLRLQPGDRLLDIGCGFGGLLVHAARTRGVTGMGITNSADHARVAAHRIADGGLADRLQIVAGDYQRCQGRFDKIVSVGMMEHVPRREYGNYVGTFRRLLPRHGLGLIHTIGCVVERNRHDPFIQKYVFPGSNQPRLSEIATALEREALPILDVENMARHYYHTVRQWLMRFRSHRHRLDPHRYSESFLRIWEYYLSCGVAAALFSESALFQVLFAADCREDIPLQRI